MKRLKSVLVEDMEHCCITGSTNYHIHHVFPGSRRKLSEKYGFVVPVAPWLHEFSKKSIHENPNKGLDLELKQIAQKYFETHYGNREDFIRVFGRNYL